VRVGPDRERLVRLASRSGTSGEWWAGAEDVSLCGPRRPRQPKANPVRTGDAKPRDWGEGNPPS
jgi:hypothetical protein